VVKREGVCVCVCVCVCVTGAYWLAFSFVPALSISGREFRSLLQVTEGQHSRIGVDTIK
jgi:hypothetical protein